MSRPCFSVLHFVEGSVFFLDVFDEDSRTFYCTIDSNTTVGPCQSRNAAVELAKEYCKGHAEKIDPTRKKLAQFNKAKRLVKIKDANTKKWMILAQYSNRLEDTGIYLETEKEAANIIEEETRCKESYS